jgi:hypothetical protein
MTLVERVGGWDTNPGAIGEDMHMYLKCFFALAGNLHAKVIYAAASQCNVSSDKQGMSGYVDGFNARYKQALRHMWGSLDTGYAIRQAFKITSEHCNTRLAQNFSTMTISELGSYSSNAFMSLMATICAPNWTALSKDFPTSKPPFARQVPSETLHYRPIHKSNFAVVFLRLFEAHFLPLHLPLILAVSAIYENFTSLIFPREFAMALAFASYCRWVGWVLVVCFFYRYETYLKLCVRLRKEEMRQAGLVNDENADEGYCPRVFRWFGVMEAGTFPLGGFVFGAIPACQAILSHVFTERLTYQVSLKPQLGLRKIAP